MNSNDIWHKRREKAATQELANGIAAFTADKFLSPSALVTIDDMIVAHRKAWKAKGLEYPEAVALALPTMHFIRIYRRDLEDKHIQTAIANMIVEIFPRNVDAGELTRAVKRAWPHYTLSMVLSIHDYQRQVRRERVETIN